MNDTIDPEKASSTRLTTQPVHAGTFLRGLTIGALVGAAVAGSAIWRRWHRGNGDDIASDTAGDTTGGAGSDSGR